LDLDGSIGFTAHEDFDFFANSRRKHAEPAQRKGIAAIKQTRKDLLLLGWGKRRALGIADSMCGMPGWQIIAVAAIAVGGWLPFANGHDLTPSMGRPATERKHFQGDQLRRAGNPQWISPLAKPTESPHEEGYYVGGGAREKSRRGEERRHNEGVWGTDYTGLIIPKHTNLNWWHGRRYQGGVGAYPTDGPRVLHRP
jgi:hypothetical protein